MNLYKSMRLYICEDLKDYFIIYTTVIKGKNLWSKSKWVKLAYGVVRIWSKVVIGMLLFIWLFINFNMRLHMQKYEV